MKIKLGGNKFLIFWIPIVLIILLIGAIYAVGTIDTGYKINSGETLTIDAHGVCKKVTRTGADSIFIPTKTDAEWTAFRSNATGVTLTDCTGGPTPCPGTPTVTDIDGHTYDTVQIGTQCWMKQGLNTGTRINASTSQGTSCSSIQKYCNNDIDANCDSNNNPNYPDGGLYQWNQMMCGSTAEGVQGICPVGWHVPTDADYYTLENYLKDIGQTCVANRGEWDCDTAGTKLKPNGTSGFEGNLAGYATFDWSFNGRGLYANLWTSSQTTSKQALRRQLYKYYSTIYRSQISKNESLTVRCIKN